MGGLFQWVKWGSFVFAFQAQAYTSCLPSYVTETFYPMSLGFYRRGEIQVPPGVETALDSIFEIYVPDDPEIESSIEYSPSTLAELNKAAKEICSKGEAGFCDLEITRYGRASAFTFMRANNLETADHVVRSFINLMRKKGVKAVLSIPVVVRQGDQYQTLIAKIDETNATAEPLKWDRIADHAHLTLSVDLAVPLKAANLETLKYGSEVYVAGFPGMTRNRRIFEKPDATGKELMITKGQRVDPYNAFRSINVSEETICQDMPNIETWKDRYLFVSADGNVGNSGGPILNPQGEVVGILTGVAPDPQSIANGGAAVTEFLLSK